MNYSPRYGTGAGTKPATGMPMKSPYSRPDHRPMGGDYGFGGTITVQGDVTVNLPVNNSLPEVRQANSGARHSIVHPMEMYSHPDQIQIKQHDLVWILANEHVLRKNAARRDGRPYAFSSMTGIETRPDRFRNQEEFEESFFLIGRAKSDYNFGDPAQHKTGIAVQTQGSFTTDNNGWDYLSPGDFWQWAAFSIDPEVRKTQKATIRRVPGQPRDKLPAIIKRVRWEDIFKLPHVALATYMQDYEKMSASEKSQFLRMGAAKALNDADMTSQRRLFLSAMRADATIGLLTGLSVLMQAGVVQVTPGLNLTQLQASDLDGLNNLAKDDALIDALKLLAEALGVVEGGSHQVGLVDAIIRRQNTGLMDREGSFEKRNQASIARLNGNAAAFAAVQPGDFVTKLERDQHNYARLKYGAFGDAYRYSTANISGVVTKAAEPGERFDTVM